MPLAHAQLALGGGGPWPTQSALGSPSSIWPLQLSSLPLQTSGTGVSAVQPIHCALVPSHVSMPGHEPASLATSQACVTPARPALHGHDWPPSGTHHLAGAPGKPEPPPPSLPPAPPPSAPAPPVPPPSWPS